MGDVDHASGPALSRPRRGSSCWPCSCGPGSRASRCSAASPPAGWSRSRCTSRPAEFRPRVPPTIGRCARSFSTTTGSPSSPTCPSRPLRARSSAFVPAACAAPTSRSSGAPRRAPCSATRSWASSRTAPVSPCCIASRAGRASAVSPATSRPARSSATSRIAPGGFAERLRATHQHPAAGPDRASSTASGSSRSPASCGRPSSCLAAECSSSAAERSASCGCRCCERRGDEVVVAEPTSERRAAAARARRGGRRRPGRECRRHRGRGDQRRAPPARSRAARCSSSRRPSTTCRRRSTRSTGRELHVVGSRSATPGVLSRRGRAPAGARPARGDRPAVRAVPRGSRPLPQRRGAEDRVHAVKAARLYAPGDLRIEDVPKSGAGAGRGARADRGGADRRHRSEDVSPRPPDPAARVAGTVRARVLRARRRAPGGRGQLGAVRGLRRLRTRASSAASCSSSPVRTRTGSSCRSGSRPSTSTTSRRASRPEVAALARTARLLPTRRRACGGRGG